MTCEWNRKECKPEDTIERIKNILERNKINVTSEYYESKEHFFSSRLEISGLSGVGTNGKGVSREYSLASAYGELMERLQSGALTASHFPLKEKREIIFHDEVIYDINDIRKNRIIDYLVDNDEATYSKVIDLLNQSSKFRVCAPFYSMKTKMVEYLPVRLVETICRSNGLCAGNSPEEALVQGTCEIFERYVHKMIFQKQITLPIIPIEEISHLNSFKMIETLIQNGFQVFVKDCTLEGVYPVIGVLIIDSKRSRYKFSIGSDPDIDIALQRCITEMFQGAMLDNNFINNRMMPVNYLAEISSYNDWHNKENFYQQYNEWIKSLSVNLGHFPMSIFLHSNNASNYKNAFIQKGFSNREAFQHLKNILSKTDNDVFVRDYSFLGFPTYRVYIPGMSECKYFLDEEIDFFKNENNIHSLHLDICGGDKKDLEKLIGYLTNVKKSPYMDIYGVFNYLYSIIEKNKSEVIGLDDNIILAQCCLLKKDFANSFRYFREYIKNANERYFELDYLAAVLLYINNRNLGIPENTIIDLINTIYGNDLGEKLRQDFKDNNILQNYKYPSCPSCEICKLEQQCCYKQWKNIDNILLDMNKSNKICQEDLIKIFEKE